MSWERVESLPSEARARAEAGPFRLPSEPVLATRTPPGLRERVVLFLRSTPELPSARAAHQVELTLTHLYVRWADGRVERAARDALGARGSEPGRVIYSVRAGEPLALQRRPHCPVQRALDEQLGADEQPLSGTIQLERALGQAVVAGFVLFALRPDRLPFAPRALEGPTLPLSLLAGLVLGHALFAYPLRLRLDRLGLSRHFGLLGLFHQRLPPDAFARVHVEAAFRFGLRAGHRIVLARKRGRPITLEAFLTSERDHARTLALARTEAELAARYLGVPLADGRDGTPARSD